MRSYLLQQGFEAQARRAPEAVALVGSDGKVRTYGELEKESRGLALAMRSSGLEPGGRVGIWMRKSPEAVAAMLGALRAGGVYVPLDATAPEARIRRLATECPLQILCADAGRESGGWPRQPGLRMEAGSGAWREWAAVTEPLPPPERTSADLAYILFTSGSTGEPKGVMLTHAHAVQFVEWASEQVGLNASDRVASHAPFHFDLSIFDLWAGLGAGARVCLLDGVSARFPAAVSEWFELRRISVWYSVPTALVALLPWLERMGSARTVIFAGEVFPPAGLRKLRAGLPQAVLHNWYGPTETNVCAHYRLPAAPEAPPEPLPIGAACPNFCLEVLDEHRRPVVAGVQGYLWARGPGVMAGYWGDEARSAEVMWRRKGEEGSAAQVLYNTGDLVSRDSEGQLHFHGRRDDLVKCRGYRVSLLEVQQRLERCPGVEHAAVLAGPDPRQAQSLRAVVAAALPLDPAVVRGFCADQLPAWQVPDAVEVRAQLPLTANGKVDRHRLLAEWQQREAGA